MPPSPDMDSPCPECHAALVLAPDLIECECCGFSLPREVCGVHLCDEDVQSLIEGRAIGPVRDLKSATGRTFSARIRLGPGGRIDLIFGAIH